VSEDEDEVINIDGMKLNKPYYFQTLIENKDPILIIKEDTPEYNAYSRTCRSDQRRQPVIITDKQLAKINKEHNGFLRDEDVIKYGSDETHSDLNYICPRYWCLKNNTIIDPKDLKEIIGKDGKKELIHPTCGKVLPRNEKEVKPGYYIYEFYEPEYKKKKIFEDEFTKSDTDKDGLIDFNEFKKILTDLKEMDTEKSWTIQYTRINNGAKPTPIQIQEFMQKQELNIRKTFDFVDTDKNNKINMKEFIDATTPKKYPGLIPDKHPDGLCLPCCFEKYNTDGRITDNKKCFDNQKPVQLKDVMKEASQETKAEVEEPVKPLPEPEVVAEVVKPKKGKAVIIPNQDEYIIGPEKFPLPDGRWGYLPFGIQKMLREINADCQISKTNTNIKPNHPCLLRHGVEVNPKQSFIACVSDVLFFNKTYKDVNDDNKLKFKKILNIKEMRDRIIESITIDSFVTYQNGNLVTDFHDMSKKDTIDVTPYKDFRIFTKLNTEKEADLFYMKKVISAYENFISFLRDDDAIIDHTYLWDIISMPNKNLFFEGINLIIFKLPDDDITNNVQLLCPTNHYSSEYYKTSKPTVFIVKQDGYYEPIYLYTVKEKLNVITTFKEERSQISPVIKSVLNEIIHPMLNMICKPLDSMPNVYRAKRSINLVDLCNKLEYYDYKVKTMVVNFNSKVIGVVAEEPKTMREGFVPCYPSSIDDSLKDIDFVYMTDLTIWKSYNTTVKFLDNLSKRSKKRREVADIPCKPLFKIVENEWVVGILTETNQFIQLSQPISKLDADDDFKLPNIEEKNYIINNGINIDTKPLIPIDIPISTQDDVDQERVDFIKKTKMETDFYNVFRNTIRILLNDYENFKIREQIEKELSREYIIYSEKLTNIDELLKRLVNRTIRFEGDENYYKLINQISTCIVKNKEECSANPKLCTFTTDDGKCNLILPEKNLITKKDNELIYFKRMSDELIRYSRIKSFILQPQKYLSFGNIGYNLNDNEIIMIQSLLTQEYFETLVPAVINKYTKFNSYDEAEPAITQIYENKTPLINENFGAIYDEKCDDPKDTEGISSGLWKKCFPENYKELEYNKTCVCTFRLVIDLVERQTTNRLTVAQIKKDLYEEYTKYFDRYQDKIIDILIIEGKKNLGKQVKTDKIDFATFISNDKYFLTTLDLWLLVQKYSIPTIFISQNCILQTKYEKRAFLAFGEETDNFVFIVLPGFRDENIPNYKLIKTNTGEVFIPISNLICPERVIEITDKITIEGYLEDFTKNSKTNYQKKTKCKDNDKGDEGDEGEEEEKAGVKFKIDSGDSLEKKKKTKKNKEKLGGKRKNISKRRIFK